MVRRTDYNITSEPHCY